MMKSLIYFLFFVFSIFVYAESFQIVLDPFQGEQVNWKEPNIRYKQPVADFKVSRYTAECSLATAENDFSEQCLLTDVQYETEQCGDGNLSDDISDDVMCVHTDVTRDHIDTSVLPHYPLETILAQPTYLKECSRSLYEDGSYSEYCHSPDEEKQTAIEDVSEDSTKSFESAGFQKVTSSYPEEINVPEPVESATSSVSQLIVQFNSQRGEPPPPLVAGSQRGERTLGSGFFIKDLEDQSLLITAYHVFESMLRIFFESHGHQQNWFLENSPVLFYAQQGDQKFRIKGVRDISVTMDLAVLEVENYQGDTLKLAKDYSNETPVYIVGYPGGHRLTRIKADHPFFISELEISFMTSSAHCHTLGGVSGSPVLNSTGEVVGLAFGGHHFADCEYLSIIPIDGFNSVNLTSSLKTNKKDIASLMEEKEFLFYNQLLSDSVLRATLIKRVLMYTHERKFFSDFLQSTTQNDLSRMNQALSESKIRLNQKDRRVLQLFVQRSIVQDMDIEDIAQLGDVEAKFLLGHSLYNQQKFEESHQIFQELVQLRLPLHLYMLSRIYYAENNLSQACRLLTYAEEPVSNLDRLYKRYECDSLIQSEKENIEAPVS